MTTKQKARKVVEFGDFQTPASLAGSVCRLLASLGLAPTSLLEPTCGTGSFLKAALAEFPTVQKATGIDINPSHLATAREELEQYRDPRAKLGQQDFFSADWQAILADLPDPLLVLGNPPWVTNSQVGAIRGSNLPPKINMGLVGLEAMTGKSNFDISEWMLWHLLESLHGRHAHLAMLCKTAVARKVLERAWKGGFAPHDSRVHRIDASRSFGVSVDACLLVCDTRSPPTSHRCQVYSDLQSGEAASSFGLRDGALVANVDLFERWKHLRGEERYRWRSGVKHDCSRVMELRRDGQALRNGLGEVVDIEKEYLYPMAKGSQIANGWDGETSRWMLVPQRHVGDDTAPIKDAAPRTWRYLQQHADLLDRRASSIYRNRPRFSVFGIGDYSFSMWKVAIAGLYKRLVFQVVGPIEEKPTMLDDTSYFVPCQDEAEARLVASLLSSHTAFEFFSGFVFWDQKRPITAGLLRRLDLLELAREEGRQDELRRFLHGAHKLQPSLGAEF